MPHRNGTSANTQRGAVLMISLMILLIMTVIGIAAMSSTTMEEKMAANSQQRQQAFQAAETALRSAEDWLTANITRVSDLSDFDGSGGLYSQRPTTVGATLAPPTFNIFDETAWAANGVATGALLNGQAAPRYIIEYIGDFGSDRPLLDPSQGVQVARYAFRITAMGWSVDGTARYLLRSHYARRLN